MSAVMPNKDSVLKSLAAAADVARQAYMLAIQSNPGQDLSALYAREMAAMNAWSDATVKALGPNPAIKAAQADLDTITNSLRGDLSTVKSVAAWVTRLDKLVGIAVKVAGYFA